MTEPGKNIVRETGKPDIWKHECYYKINPRYYKCQVQNKRRGLYHTHFKVHGVEGEALMSCKDIFKAGSAKLHAGDDAIVKGNGKNYAKRGFITRIWGNQVTMKYEQSGKEIKTTKSKVAKLQNIC